MDMWVDTDRFVLPYARVAGFFAVLGAALLNFVYLPG